MASSINSLIDGFEVVAKTQTTDRITAKKVLGFVNNPALVVSKDYPFSLVLEMSNGCIAAFRTPTDQIPELFPELFYIRDKDQPMTIKGNKIFNLGYSFIKTTTNAKHNHAFLKESGRIPVKMEKGIEFTAEENNADTVAEDSPFQL